MKVLYLAHFCDGAGWAIAAENYVRALQSVGVDVVARPIVIHGVRKPSEDIEKLFFKEIRGCTHVIQHTLPTHWDFSEKVKNIGLFVTETDNINYTHWENKLKCMDQVCVPNTEMQHNINVGTKLVPHACDISVYNKKWPTVNIPQLKDKLVFYFVGENIRRKRINAILTAYNSAFDVNDNVVLVIKTGRSGQSPQDTANDINQSNNTVKKSLRLYAKRDLYPELVIIPSQITNEELYGLHQSSDCFVNATFGDAWNQPCFDALGFGNTIISPLIGGMKDYLFGAIKCYPVMYNMDICFGADPFLPDLHTGRELWASVNINHLSEQMKAVYKDYLGGNVQKIEQHRKLAEKYSYENIGKLMVYYLEN